MSYTGRKSLGGRKSAGGRQSLAPSRTQYSFPVLKDNEIIENINDMSIPLTEAELRQPNHEVLRAIFTNSAEFLMGVTADELNQPRFSGLEELSYPELHEISVPRIQLFRAAAKVRVSTRARQCRSG
jgi:kinetochore protein Nuf2